MKGSSLFKFVFSCAVLAATSSALPGSFTTAQLSKVSQVPVIVILKDQLSSLPPSRESMTPRAAAIASAQTEVLGMLQRSGNHTVHSFSTINAFATKVTASEATALANHPDVQAVVPDAVIRAPRLQKDSLSQASGAASASPTDNGLCNTLEPEALQLTHTAYLDTSTPQAQEVVDGNGEKVTGKGVKVAWIADGIDINNPSFIRADGSHVFIDYEDFSGDPAGTPTDGGEAFLRCELDRRAGRVQRQGPHLRHQPVRRHRASAALALQHPHPRHGARRLARRPQGVFLRRDYHDVLSSYRPSSGPSSTTRWTCSTNPSAATPIPTTTTTRFRSPTRPPWPPA